MERSEESRRPSFQPGLVVVLVAVPFVTGALVFSWTLYDTLSCIGAGDECEVAVPMTVFFSVLGLALMFLPGLAALVFALYESPGHKGLERWGGL